MLVALIEPRLEAIETLINPLFKTGQIFLRGEERSEIFTEYARDRLRLPLIEAAFVAESL